VQSRKRTQWREPNLPKVGATKLYQSPEKSKRVQRMVALSGFLANKQRRWS
jgi:hypothetical protein